jgi:hypothetical protein
MKCSKSLLGALTRSRTAQTDPGYLVSQECVMKSKGEIMFHKNCNFRWLGTKSTLNILLIFDALVGSPIYANASGNGPYYIKDGTYDTSASSMCAVTVINDLPNNSLRLNSASVNGKTCIDAALPLELKRSSQSEFTYYFPSSDSARYHVLTDEAVQACAPSHSNPMPCDQLFYSSSGTLLFKAGDVSVVALVLDIYDSKAFHYSAHFRLLRGQEVLADRLDDTLTGEYQLFDLTL